MTDFGLAAQRALLAEVRRRAEIRATLLETICERAIQGGLYGVLVIREPDGTERAGVHPSVPYGWIHEYRDGLPPHLI